MAVATLALVAACGSPVNHPSPTHDSLVIATSLSGPADTTTLGGTWYLQPVLASDTATGKRPFLVFDLAKTRFSGNTGCNNMHGTFWFSKEDSSLSFSDKITLTKMACEGYNELSFLKSLRSTGRYRLQQGVLTLFADDHAELSHWTRKPTSGPKALRV